MLKGTNVTLDVITCKNVHQPQRKVPIKLTTFKLHFHKTTAVNKQKIYN